MVGLRRPLLAAALVTATLYGLPDRHAHHTAADIAAQGHGQDLVTLLTVPMLLWATRRGRCAHVVILGLQFCYTCSYLLYALATRTTTRSSRTWPC